MSTLHLQPSPRALAEVRRRQAAVRVAWPVLTRPLQRLTWEGSVPPTGPLLVLANHAHVFDPFNVAVAARREVCWIGTRTAFSGPGSTVVRGLGSIPKTRFERDMMAVRLAQLWLREGAAVGLFPEGERTWDGRLGELPPGLGRLIRALRVPVVVARAQCGYRQWPRWAARPRRGATHVAFDPPRDLRAMAPEAIEELVRERLSVDPRAGGPVRGRRLAEGVENVVFRCLACGRDDALRSLGETLSCGCGAAWRVDGDNQLWDVAGGSPQRLEDVAQALREAQLDAWRNADGPLLEVDGVRLRDEADETAQVWLPGTLRLTRSELCFTVNGEVVWRAPVARLRAVSVEYGRTLEWRVDARWLRVDIPTGSAWRWGWGIRAAADGGLA